MNDISPAQSTALVVTSAFVPAVVFAPGGVDDILARALTEQQATAIVVAIARGEVRHTKVSY